MPFSFGFAGSASGALRHRSGSPVGIVPGRKPVGHVALLGQAGQLDDPNLGRDPVKVLGDLAGVLPAGLVIVGEDVDDPTLEPVVQVRRPLPGAFGGGGRDEAERRESIGVLLALADEHLVADRLQHLGQAVGDLRPLGLAPAPARAVPVLLPEPLGLVPEHLGVRLALRVVVDVLGDDPGLRGRGPAVGAVGPARSLGHLVEAVARRLVGRPPVEPELVDHVVAAGDWIVSREAVDDEAVRRGGLRLHAEAAVRGGVAGAGADDLAAGDVAAEGEGRGAKIGKGHGHRRRLLSLRKRARSQASCGSVGRRRSMRASMSPTKTRSRSFSDPSSWSKIQVTNSP